MPTPLAASHLLSEPCLACRGVTGRARPWLAPPLGAPGARPCPRSVSTPSLAAAGSSRPPCRPRWFGHSPAGPRRCRVPAAVSTACEHVSAAGLPGPAAILCLALAELPSGLPPRARASRRLRDLAGTCYFPPSPVAALASVGWCLIVGSGHWQLMTLGIFVRMLKTHTFVCFLGRSIFKSLAHFFNKRKSKF